MVRNEDYHQEVSQNVAIFIKITLQNRKTVVKNFWKTAEKHVQTEIENGKDLESKT